MNRNVVSAALVFSLGLIALGIAGCQPSRDTNLNATASSSPVPEKFDPVAIEAEVTKLAREWIQAGQTHNAEPITRVVADDAILHYPDGTTATKADELRLIESKAITADSWDLLDHKVTVLNADTAIITGRSGLKNGKYKDANMPKPIDISGEYRFLDVYARRNGRWQVVASQATKLAVASPSPTP